MPTSDWLIIGGGAAGLMAAGAACAAGQRVTLLEHNPKGTGQKLLITGKGRCNVTNDCDAREFLRYVRRNPRFLYSCLFAFPPAAAMQLFESLGVPLKVERGRRVFPQSDRAADILAALRAYAAGAQVVAANADGLLIENGACAGAVAAGRTAPAACCWPPAASATRPPAATAPAMRWRGRPGTPSCRRSRVCAAWSARTPPAAA